ncbi:unnamed protein product [Paramecium sonneborni]|uniref:Transmembrane protein n=1 Tax=Paramecium sonneborni TaxID=65129 RepID=A0A8S1LMC5_9CILI|nr:unnamed protein product [Paramecium sonneborni]
MVSLKKIQVGQPSIMTSLAILQTIPNSQEQKQNQLLIQYYPKNMEELVINILLAFRIIYVQMIALLETFIMIIKSIYGYLFGIHKKNGFYFFFELIKNLSLIILCFNIRLLQFATKFFQQPLQNPVKNK